MSASTTDTDREPAAAPADPETEMRSILQRIATGPELSKDISRAEACAAMRFILDGRVNPVRAGIFLIALRMKRETDEENLGILDALRQSATITTAEVDEVVDVADPYDGFTRSLPVSPFLPAVLAACGVPAVSHGVERMGPKYGVTHRQVLRAAGLPVDLSPAEAAARIADPKVGWAYLDQRAFAPKLYALHELRTLIVKRPALTTVEVLLGPIRGRRRSHLVTGYVHKPYPRIYALLARASGFDSALIVRGTEGGVIPSLRQPGRFYYYRERGAEQVLDVDPATLGITSTVRALAPMTPAGERSAGGGGGEEAGAAFETDRAAEAAAAAGREALEGRPGPARDALVYAGAMCLWHLGRYETPQAAAEAVRTVLDEGRAAARLVA